MFFTQIWKMKVESCITDLYGKALKLQASYW